MADYHTNTLTDALRRLAGMPFLAAAARFMRDNAEAINAELGQTVVGEIPAFSESGNPDVLSDLADHGPQHTAEIIRLLGGAAVSDFVFVRRHAHRRAEQRFPLEATLHAYRCGHKVFSQWIRRAIMSSVIQTDDAPQAIAAVADFAIEYTDAVSTIVASEYVNRAQLLADVAGDQRAELLGILLNGYDESDRRVARILRHAGYLDHRQAFCVVLAHSVDPTEMLNPARARRIADSVDKVLKRLAVRSVIDVRDGKVTVVVSAPRRTSGWTAPNAALAARVATKLTVVGNAVLVGVSNDVPSTSQIPVAYEEALLALDFASVTNRVSQISDIRLQNLVLHLAGDKIHRALPRWTTSLFDADDKQRGVLIETLRAYADADMNVLKSAGILDVHPNTIYARMDKISDITGMDAKHYHALNELLVAAECRNLPVVDQDTGN